MAPLTPASSEARNGLLAAAAELSTTSSRSSARSVGVADAVDDSSRSANGFVGGTAADYKHHIDITTKNV